MTTIAVLLTCHNRREKSLACLEALFKSTFVEKVSLDVFLLDDGSSDGTADAVKELFPHVHVLYGDGTLYWNGGMRVVFSAAMKGDFDYYLWLNDDTYLYNDAVATLINTAETLHFEKSSIAIVVGTAQSGPGLAPTYGGEVRISRLRPITYRLVTPTNTYLPCDTMNGNCVLVPREIAVKIGIMDPAFIHTMGDIDYGLRAAEAGFEIVVMPGFAGICGKNSAAGTFADSDLKMRDRYKRILGAKGLPLRSWYVFTKRHCGTFWIIFWLWPYVRIATSAFASPRKWLKR